MIENYEKRVINVTWHGRGGQGAVTAAMILANAAYLDGYEGVTAAPFFGVERRGAPITATTRLSRVPIRSLSQTTKSDVIIVLDERLIQTVDVMAGLRPQGLLIVNSSRSPEAFCNGENLVVATSDANAIAREIGLVVAGTVLINTPMLGAFSRASRLVTMKSLERAIGDNFKKKAAVVNVQGARRTYEVTKIGQTWQP
ncbi:MAG: 2-oxoacid:acceptor oxidoreductase family protein [Deltaproteobacteria bacterium]|nr:MAG: 2-oxoacid:acceptor oxidoreductase family protein [Deltaproteobacteria bacterium]